MGTVIHGALDKDSVLFVSLVRTNRLPPPWRSPLTQALDHNVCTNVCANGMSNSVLPLRQSWLSHSCKPGQRMLDWPGTQA